MTPRHLLAFAATLLLGACATQAPRPASPPTRAAVVDRPADPGALEEFCRTANCRHDVTIRMRKRDGSVYEKHVALMPPAVQRGVVGVLPGESIRVVPVFDHGTFDGWREAAADEPQGTPVLSVKLEQTEGQTDFMAAIHNEGDANIKLKLGLMTLDDDSMHATSSCPILARASGFELWPQPVFTLLIASAEILAADAEMVCN